jgi:hypothetical protein
MAHHKTQERQNTERRVETPAPPLQQAGTNDDHVHECDEPTPTTPREPGLILRIGIEDITLDQYHLTEPESFADVWQLIETATEPIVLHLDGLADWAAGPRRNLLTLLAEFAGRCQITIDDHPVPYDGPLEAVLAAMVGDEDVEKYRRGRQTAIEAACLFCPNALAEASGQIARRLTKLGVRDIRVEDIQKEISQLAVAFQKPREG